MSRTKTMINSLCKEWDYQSISLKPLVDEWNKHKSMSKSKQKGMKGLQTIDDKIIEIYGEDLGWIIIFYIEDLIQLSYKDITGEHRTFDYIIPNISNKIWIKLYKDLDKKVNEEMINNKMNVNISNGEYDYVCG